MTSNMNFNGIKLFPATEGGRVFLEVRIPEGRLIDMPELSVEEARELRDELSMALIAIDKGEDHQASWIRNEQFAKG